MIVALCIITFVSVLLSIFCIWELRKIKNIQTQAMLMQNTVQKRFSEHVESVNSAKQEFSAVKDDLQKKFSKLAESVASVQQEYSAVKTDLQEKIQLIKGQMFIHEGILLQENGKWCLEFNDSKKYFTPGKIAKVMAPDCESDFTYQDDTVTCICRKNGEIISEIIYKNNGAPVSGKVYMNGKAIKKFEYDELGQVAKEYEL